MSLTLAGSPLLLPDEALCAWAEHQLDPRAMRPYRARAWPGARLTRLAFPTGVEPAGPPRIGRFEWPRGASRWARGCFLASAAQVDAVRAEAFGPGGDEDLPVELVLDGGPLGESVTTEVYVLPPVPIGLTGVPPGADVSDGLYLLNVVDERYYWWQVPWPDAPIGGATTWADLYAAASEALDLDGTIAFDAVPEAYGRPHASLHLPYEPLPLVLDAVAYNCGQRVVRRYDGAVEAISAATSRFRLEANLTADRLAWQLGGGRQFTDQV